MYHTSVNVNLMVENVIRITIGITINVGMNPKERSACKQDYISNPPTCSFESGRYLKSIIDSSIITCDKMTDTAAKLYAKTTKNTLSKTALTNFKEEKVTCKTKNFYILLTFLLITISL